MLCGALMFSNVHTDLLFLSQRTILLSRTKELSTFLTQLDDMLQSDSGKHRCISRIKCYPEV